MLTLAVVVASYNRYDLLLRLLDSIAKQNIFVEVIVVDDASTQEYINLPENVTYLKQSINKGPGVCRNVGLLAASAADWIIIMDDDDYFADGILSQINAIIEKNNFLYDYPAFQLPRSNAFVSHDYLLASISDYMNGSILGDFLPIINRNFFLQKGYQYPTTRIGGEHLLWWEIANDYGVPIWSKPVSCILGTEADVRLTSPSTQIKRAAEHMQLAQQTLDKFGVTLKKEFPEQYQSRLMALITYALLSGNKVVAKKTLLQLKPHKKLYFIFSILMLVPQFLLVKIFTYYRQFTLKRSD